MDNNVQAKIEAFEENEKKKKRIFGIVVAFLIIVFFAGLAWGINDVLLTEGTQALPAAEPVFSVKEPTDAAEAVKQFKLLSSFAFLEENSAEVKLSRSTSLSVDSDSISDDAPDEEFDIILRYIKDGVLENIKGEYPSYSEPFGSVFSGEMILSSFSENDISSYEYSADTNNNENHYLSFVFNNAEYPQKPGEVLYDNFDMADGEAVGESIKTKVSSFAEIRDADIICDGFSISTAFNAVTQRVDYIDYTRRYSVTLNIDFCGDLKDLGTRKLSFIFSAKESYAFTYAGLRLSDSVMWLEKGATDNLEAFRTVDGEVEVKWESSDPEIAEVDSEGYIKGNKISETPVIVSATMEYLGKTYTASCEVYVRKPVKKMKPENRELLLSPGETSVLGVNISPEKATVKKVLWFSEDESIVTVDEQGKVTAVGDGTAVVYAISLDGNYKASCEITVKGGADNG